MKRKKLRLKKQVYFVLILLITPILVIVGNKVYKTKQYQKTYEYKLLQIDYSLKDIKLLEQNITKEEIENLTTQPKDEDLLNLLKAEHYKKRYLKEYQKYIKEEQVTIETAIKVINLHQNYHYYEKDFKTNIEDEYQMLVNKYYALPSDYEPSDLIQIPTKHSWGDDNYTRKEVYDAFLEMWDGANENGYYLMINSAYRSYQDQEAVYDNYKNKRGEKYADSIAARPGFSEHQTGLALDIFEKENSSSATFKDSECYAWLKENSYKYGFILRFPEEKESLTGYNPEAWHYRYVGKDLAQKVYTSGLTYDEYYIYYIEK